MCPGLHPNPVTGSGPSEECCAADSVWEENLSIPFLKKIIVLVMLDPRLVKIIQINEGEKEAQFGEEARGLLGRCSCLRSRYPRTSAFKGLKIAPGFTVAWLPPGGRDSEAPAEAAWMVGPSCSLRAASWFWSLASPRDTCMSFWHRTVRGNCREGRALLGCLACAWGPRLHGTWAHPALLSECRGCKRSQEFTCGHQAPGLLLVGAWPAPLAICWDYYWRVAGMVKDPSREGS